jgi:hypothetical protein
MLLAPMLPSASASSQQAGGSCMKLLDVLVDLGMCVSLGIVCHPLRYLLLFCLPFLVPGLD